MYLYTVYLTGATFVKMFCDNEEWLSTVLHLKLPVLVARTILFYVLFRVFLVREANQDHQEKLDQW